eukprot:5634383-Amphidinium_carterae.1
MASQQGCTTCTPESLQWRIETSRVRTSYSDICGASRVLHCFGPSTPIQARFRNTRTTLRSADKVCVSVQIPNKCPSLEAVLHDFDLATEFQKYRTTMTATATTADGRRVGGTPQYMAPERFAKTEELPAAKHESHDVYAAERLPESIEGPMTCQSKYAPKNDRNTFLQIGLVRFGGLLKRIVTRAD